MFPARRSTALAAALTALALALAFAPVASAAPGDADARKALRQALEEDYLETRFDDAVLRLRGAIQRCAKDACSPELVAKLHAALGSVLAGGKRELEDASDEFVEALKADPKVEPDPDVASEEVTFAYEKARKKLHLGPVAAPAPAPPPAPKPRPAPRVEEPPAPPPPVEEPPKKPARKNWFTLAFQPDLALISGSNVCTTKSQTNDHYYCVRENKTRYVGTPTVGNADNVDAGVALSTMRLMLGYERLVLENLSLGGRIGFAFNGAGDGAKFLPLHAEVRGSLWTGRDPFGSGAVVRPFFFFAGGVAQVDSKVNVKILEDGKACGAKSPADITSPCSRPSSDGVVEKRQQTLATYHQAGTGFAAGGFGLQFVPTAAIALHLGVRAGVTFPVVTAVFSPEGGLSVGF